MTPSGEFADYSQYIYSNIFSGNYKLQTYLAKFIPADATKFYTLHFSSIQFLIVFKYNNILREYMTIFSHVLPLKIFIPTFFSFYK